MLDTSTIRRRRSSHYFLLGFFSFSIIILASSSTTCRFGLSYTTFVILGLSIGEPSSYDEHIQVVLDVTVKNTGERMGSEVVQVYVTYPNIGLTTPALQLKGFAKAHSIQGKQSKGVVIKLDKYAFSFWDETKKCWDVGAGKYLISVGSSSDDLVMSQEFQLERSFQWRGL